jgi:hypothetical protein
LNLFPIYIIFALLLGVVVATSGDVYAQGGNDPKSDVKFSDFLEKYSLTSITQEDFEMLKMQVVLIEQDNTSQFYLVSNSQVDLILDELGLSYSTVDNISPGLDQHIANLGAIKVVRVNYEDIEEVEVIPFETQYIDDANLEVGNEYIVQDGEDGQLTVVFTVKYEEGSEVERTEGKQFVSKQPINKIIARGTKQPVVSVPDVKGANISCEFWDSVIDSVTSDPIERGWMKHVMRCESACNPHAGQGRTYLGLFQFSLSTFQAYGGTDIFDGNQQIHTALNIYRLGGGDHHWGYCSYTFPN